MIVAMVMPACGGEEPPTCQQAVGHFYAAGCYFYDLQTNQPFSEGAIVSNCREALATAPPQCEDELADFRFCLAGVPSPVESNSDCDCSAEQEALLTCD